MVYLFVYIVEAECGDDRWWFEILDSIQGAEKGQHEIEMQAPIYSILGSCQPTSRVHHRRRSVFRDPVVHSNSRVSGNLNIWAPTKGSSAACLLADVYKDFMVISMFDSQGVVFFFLCCNFPEIPVMEFCVNSDLGCPRIGKTRSRPKNGCFYHIRGWSRNTAFSSH